MRMVFVFLLWQVFVAGLSNTDVLPKTTDLRFHVFVLFCDLHQLLGQ